MDQFPEAQRDFNEIIARCPDFVFALQEFASVHLLESDIKREKKQVFKSKDHLQEGVTLVCR